LATASIVPRLEPSSHEVFYKHDYPRDLQPFPYHRFDHPVPIVQDSEDYDKDFVKDENSDKGEWAVQEQYDRLRGRLAHAREVAGRLQDKESALGSRLRELQAEELRARAAADKALRDKLAAEERASKKLVEAEAEYDKAKNVKVGEHGIGNATKEVEEKTMTLEDCKKELAVARAKLKELQEERERLEAKAKAARATEDAADDHAIDEEKEEAAAESKADAAKAKYDAAHKKYERDAEAYQKAQADLEKAEATLRKFRNKVDADGGVYRSSAAPRANSIIAAVALTAALSVVGL